MRTSSCLAISKVRAEMVALFVTELRTQSLVLGKGKKAFEERNEAFFGQLPGGRILDLT